MKLLTQRLLELFHFFQLHLVAVLAVRKLTTEDFGGGLGRGGDRDSAPRGVANRLGPPQSHGADRITTMINTAAAAELAAWEPSYGRLAEAQVKWEAEHGRPLVAG